MFSELLPGVEASYEKEGSPVKIHESVSPRARQAAIDSRRLASPDHYRLYFSLIGPSHAITQAAFDDFWQATDSNPEDTARSILDLHNQMALGSLRKSDVLFERLRKEDADFWNSTRAKNILLALGNVMDEAYRQNPREEDFIVSSWARAEHLVPILYAHLAEDERAATNETFFADGEALGWLTSILRSETFAHGLWGKQKKSPDAWLLPAPEFARACDLMVARYRSMNIKQILATPRTIHILFAWNQAGDEEGPRTLLANATNTDEGLVDVLSALTSSINSSDRGRYLVLKKDNIEPFMNYETVKERLAAIASTGPAGLRERAKSLVGFADAATDF